MIGAAGTGGMPRRGGQAPARLLITEPAVVPGDHGGFMVNEWVPDNDPAAFAQQLRDVLDVTTKLCAASGSSLVGRLAPVAGLSVRRGRSADA